MRQSKAEVYLHFVWATWGREPLITAEIKRAVYRCIGSEARRLGCEALGIGGMPDHVHLALKMPTKRSPARLMQQIKGVSSAFVRDHILPKEVFGWQDSYAVFILSRPHCKRVITYIRNQKQHHATGQLWREWEETDEEAKRLGV